MTMEAAAGGAGGAGEFGAIVNLAMLPFQLGARNAQAAEALYQQRMQRYAAARESANAMDDEQRSIAAMESNKILSDLEIESNKRQAKAMAQVQAAASGVEGGTVQQVIQTVEINESLAKYSNELQTEQAIAQSLENIEGAAYSLEMATMPQFKSNAMKDMMGAVFGMAPGLGMLMSGNWGVTGAAAKGATGG